MTIIAIIAVLGLGVVGVVNGIALPALEAWAKGCNNGGIGFDTSFDKSQGGSASTHNSITLSFAILSS